jgi:predicted SAM-dependent methyltransferase
VDLFTSLRLFRRRLTGDNGRLLRRYLQDRPEPKLHIGGGWRLLDGWLNTDIAIVPGVFHMDAAKPFPLRDAAFDYVFTEHMIEHISYPGAVSMLGECFRVMRPGGVIRVVTPDFSALLRLYRNHADGVESEYHDYFMKHFIPPKHPSTMAGLANAFLRSWGHQFVYDRETLEQALIGAGFGSVVQRSLGESDHLALSGIEHEARYPPGLLDFESIALEATKCA